MLTTASLGFGVDGCVGFTQLPVYRLKPHDKEAASGTEKLAIAAHVGPSMALGGDCAIEVAPG
jgi:hypothetical protein